MLVRKELLEEWDVKKFNHAGNSRIDNTKEIGWTYLAIVMDLFNLKVVGWSYGLNMTDDLVIDAFKKHLLIWN